MKHDAKEGQAVQHPVATSQQMVQYQAVHHSIRDSIIVNGPVQDSATSQQMAQYITKVLGLPDIAFGESAFFTGIKFIS